MNWNPSCEEGTARRVTKRIALGLLATSLIATAAIPAIAGKPDRGHQGGHHTLSQEQEASASGKRRGNKSKTVRKTFTNGASIAIPDIGAAGLYPSPIAVTGFKKARITDVNLNLRGFSHNFPPDVEVLLVAPGGRNVVVMANVGDPPGAEDAVTNITLTLDDEAASALPIAELLTGGAFRPRLNDDPALVDFPAPAPTPSGNEVLSTFDGINPNGEWQLFVIDDAELDSGSFADGWTLEITAKSKATGKKKR